MEDILQKTCYYLEILISDEDRMEKENRNNDFCQLLQRNVENVIKQMSLDPFFQDTLLRTYYEIQKTDEPYWGHISLTLLLIKFLNEALLSQEVEDSNEEPGTVLRPKGLLSVNQEKTVKKSFQFIVALGILPNLIPSVQAVLNKRTRAIKLVANINEKNCLRNKYYQVVVCFIVMLQCLKQKCLQAIILTSHAGDLLATFLQLCYAPIKKTNKQKVFEFTMPSENNFDFLQITKKVKDCCSSSEENFILEMWADKRYFVNEFTAFLNQMSSSVLMWELLLFQGADLRNKNTAAGTKVPMWFQRQCNQMMTDIFIKPGGIKTFAQVALDSMCDMDYQSGSISKHKIEAVARLISSNSVKHVPIEVYVRSISEQVLELMHLKGSASDKVFKSVSSCIAVQMLERNSKLAEHYIFRTILRPLQCCFENTGDKLLINEDEFTSCIEDLHYIFILTCPILSKNSLSLLLPFYHLLFLMFAKLQSGVSFLKSLVQDLLAAILDASSKEDALKLLQIAAFDEKSMPSVHSVKGLKCAFADKGGITVIKDQEAISMETLLDEADQKCEAILQLLKQSMDKTLEVSFFLLLLKKSVTITDKDVGERLDDISIFINRLVIIHLLEQLSERVSDSLINNIDETVDLIQSALECGITISAETNEFQFGEETLMTFLVILSTLVGYGDQLTSKHWNSLKKCLPNLKKLVACRNESFLKNMAEDICIAINTHGATLASKPESHFTNSKISAKNYNDEADTLNQLVSDILLTKDNLESTNNTALLSERTTIRYQDASQSINTENFLSKSNDAKNQESAYEYAINCAKSSDIPEQGHGLITLCRLLEAKDKHAISNKAHILQLFKENLNHEDSYIYLTAIRGLSNLADVDAENVLPVLFSEFKNPETSWDITLKIGESLMKACKSLGETIVKYRDQFLSTYLICARHEDSHIRVSSLSNLGEVCKLLRFSIGPWLQEILLCLTSLLKHDPEIEVQRSAMLLARLLVQGTGADSLKILENEIKELYRLFRWTYERTGDDILKLQAQLAIEEINVIVKDILSSKPPLVKEIRILDPF